MKAHKRIILNRTTRHSERFTLINDGKGMGGVGESRGHYLRNWYVGIGIDRGNGYRGCFSVDYALSREEVPDEAKRLIRETLELGEK
jgi:hypothetical protein